MKQALTILLASVWSLIAYSQKLKPAPASAIPVYSLYNLHADTTNLKDLSKGKITFIDFWFIPCSGCFAEMKMLHTLHEKYKNNSQICFITITISDSGFIRPLIENRNTANNHSYNYFRLNSGLDSFDLPVYFIRSVNWKMKSFVEAKGIFTGRADPRHEDETYPDRVFGFTAYPTICIYNKNGTLIYTETGFEKEHEKVQQKKIESAIEVNL